MLGSVVLVFLFCSAARVVAVNDSMPIFAAGLEACLKSDSDQKQQEYNNCLLNQVKSFQHRLTSGVPELGIPTLDPLVLDNIKLNRVEPPVSINAVFSNVRVTGIKDMDVKYLNVDIFKPEKRMGMGLVVPTMIMRGQYQINGNIFLLPIEGSGNFISKLDTVIVEGSGRIIPTGQGIKTTTEDVNVGFKIKNMAMKMDNLFEGNKVLSDTMHHFLNENGQLVLEEIRPELTKTINSLISGLFTAIFDSAPNRIHRHSLGVAGLIKAANTGTPRPPAAKRQAPPQQQRQRRV